MNEIVLNAYAKINLALDIKGIYEDGYHRVEMIMQSIALHDRVKVRKKSSDIIVNCSDPCIPFGKENLAFQAAEMFFSEKEISKGAEIYIQKNIPVAAGLAGGSADAAAVLKGLYKLYDLKEDYIEMRKILSSIGMDVPFCLKGGTVFASGKGDELEFLPSIKEYPLLLVTPSVQLSTAEVYELYDQLLPDVKIDMDSILKNLKEDKEINWSLDWKNVLEEPAKKLTQEIKQVEKIIKNTDNLLYMMSGSGPSVFALYDSKEKADKAASNWPRKGDFVISTTTMGRY
ncbi:MULTISPECIES: 4-(cytidine 5'-diphospho)-2-C-methyl-D-erythritol kinase [unclassified Halanaerobium]|uniref:4-(cytidine 5'-diphospho)-2-C-methyl-D-erythritol kinase n=1 Tax=unclassified Halanaerobium TaxID=2641197 RepID=UPI000DF37013|nr:MULTISPECIES: 4-(cytidine 5'-diphospho)-2-C-methyl-D-erythritol kinase [unclassified Halanaerobium]RCW49961.1 4-diphosphocytidyl-2-C-methyl-D-erythritol kinase [Halanaerobium sp. MA284_MarDTE_T2]RCW81102.1 4-diphosphocytidyl-2-C-methyl-D-erythritol kinase [Halanaerobium sp. DL-01]